MKFLIFIFLLTPVWGKSILPSLEQFKITQRSNKKFYLIKKRDAKKLLFAEKKEKKLEIIELNVTGQAAKLINITEVKGAPEFYCVVYSAGESGTSTIMKEHRCALYNTALMRFEGDLPFQYIPKTKASSPLNYQQPQYKVEKDVLKILESGFIIKTIKRSN
jgi:hypothetical protein